MPPGGQLRPTEHAGRTAPPAPHRYLVPTAAGVDLGLVYDLAVEGDLVRITMTTTTRACPAASFLKEGASESACRVPGVETVDVTLTYDPPWRPQMMSADAKQHLGIGDGDGC